MLIGRHKEQHQLLAAANSQYSEFVAVYGRRRVGKTFLVRETFNYKFTFYHTGLARKNTREQLQSFHLALRRQGLTKAPQPSNWLEAFDMLETLIENSSDKKKVIFIDEMPWMDAPRSHFLTALEQFWNGFATARRDVLLIVCGSATSWIINKIVRNHGGLHNRLTQRVFLRPFTLAECEEYVQHFGLGMTRRQILEGYMILGGIPYYWSLLDKGLSLAQNIDALFFGRHAILLHEYDELYASLFNRPQPYTSVIEALGTKKVGMTRQQLVGASQLPDNGHLTTILAELEYCGFIRRYNCIGMKTRQAIYQLIDNFTLFYFKFMHENKGNDKHYWSKIIDKPLYYAWSGLAFERVCLLHSEAIKAKLGITGVLTDEYSWHKDGTANQAGAQIDLVIDRNDGVINLCEIKFSKVPFSINKEYDAALQRKKAIFCESTRTTKAVHLTMITDQGLVDNPYARDIHSQVSEDDLFR